MQEILSIMMYRVTTREVWCRAAVLGLAGAVSLSANGTRLPGQSAAQVGKGFAWAATADAPSAVYANPAGLATQSVAAVEANGQLLHTRYRRGDYEAARDSWLPSAFASVPLGGGVVSGAGFYVPYGSGTDWGRGTDFATIALESEITYLTGALAVAKTWGGVFEAGLALEWNENKTELSQGLGPTGVYRFEASDGAPSFTAGVRWRLTERQRVALVYHSRTRFELDGTAEVSLLNLTTPARAAWEYPDHVAVAYRWDVNERLNLEFQYEVTFWGAVDDSRIRAVGLPAQALPLDWRDSAYYNLGVGYRVNPRCTLSAGVSYSTNSIQDAAFTPALPDLDKWIFTAGTGVEFGRVRWEVAVNWAPTKTRVVSGQPVNAAGQSVNGTYRSGYVGVIGGGVVRF